MRFVSASRKIITGVIITASAVGIVNARPHCVGPTDFKCEAPVASPCPCLHDGFYIGVGGGYNVLTDDPNLNLSGPNGSFSSNLKLAAQGGDVGGFLGYGQYFQNWYLGGEVYGFWTSANTRTSFNVVGGPSATLKTTENGDWGIAILPGVALNNATLGYIKIGYDWANIKTTGNITNTVGTVTNIDNSNTLSGWMFGAGMETLVCDNWSVRGEFDYINYNHNSGNINSSPNDNRIWLTVNYHFMF